MARFRVFDVLEQALTLAFRNFGTFVRALWPFVAATAAIALLELLLLGAASAFDGEAFFAELQEGRLPDEVLVAMSGGAFFGIVARLVALVATGVGIVVAAGLLAGEKLDLAAAWQRLVPRLANLLLTGILVALLLGAVVLVGVALGVALLVGTGPMAGGLDALLFLELIPLVGALVVVLVMLLLRWAVVEPVSVLETRGVTENLRRSAELTAGSRWAILGAYIVLFLAIGLGSGLATSPVTALALATGPSLPVMALSVLFNAAVELVVAPFLAAFAVVLYRALQPAGTPVVPAPIPPPPAP